MIWPHTLITPRFVGLGSVVGAAVGSFVGLLADRVARKSDRPLLKYLAIDAVLGAIGFVGGAIGIACLPVMQANSTFRAGGMIVHTTSVRYQDSYRLAFAVAAVFALVHEIIRYRMNRQRTS